MITATTPDGTFTYTLPLGRLQFSVHPVAFIAADGEEDYDQQVGCLLCPTTDLAGGLFVSDGKVVCAGCAGAGATAIEPDGEKANIGQWLHLAA